METCPVSVQLRKFSKKAISTKAHSENKSICFQFLKYENLNHSGCNLDLFLYMSVIIVIAITIIATITRILLTINNTTNHS